jgi:hypothetical protein
LTGSFRHFVIILPLLVISCFLFTTAIQAAVPASIAVATHFSLPAKVAAVGEFLCGFFYM